MSQIDSPKKKERNEISLATLASSEGWADGEVCEGGGESGEALGWEEEGGAEVVREGRGTECGKRGCRQN